MKNATRIGIAVMSFVVIPVTTTRTTKRSIGVRPIALGKTDGGAVALFSRTGKLSFDFMTYLQVISDNNAVLDLDPKVRKHTLSKYLSLL